jgi:hypothetical protein
MVLCSGFCSKKKYEIKAFHQIKTKRNSCHYTRDIKPYYIRSFINIYYKIKYRATKTGFFSAKNQNTIHIVFFLNNLIQLFHNGNLSEEVKKKKYLKVNMN